MKANLIFVFLIFAFARINAQNYAATAIPEDLKTGARCVVREYSETFVQEDAQNGTHKVLCVMTIFDEKGDDYMNFFVYEDFFRELKSFSGEVFNAQGKLIKKIAKKDFVSTALSAHLADDGKRTFYNFHAPSYPITVKYTYELKYKNGILMYPAFNPVAGFRISVEKADYTLQIPQDVELREKKLNTQIETIHSTTGKSKVYKWSLGQFKALPYEAYSPIEELFPVIYLSPEKFCIEKNCGNMSDWEQFGFWQAELLKGRNVLPQKVIDKVTEITQNIPEKRDKVKALYQYLQNTTHYVSIQLGIGGWQPMKAEDVAKTGFGDCKALSNYMKSLLDAANIPSYYTVISTEKKRLMHDFPNFTQANHVILMVPMENDTVWLECTSQSLPFGYIHKLILGHDALAVGENKAFLCTLPEYPPLDNQEINVVDIRLSPGGNAEMDVCSTYKTDIFERMYFRLKGLDAKEENEVLSNLLKVEKPQISNFKKEEFPGEKPFMNISFKVKCDEYASKTGTRMFIPLNPAYTSLKGILSGNSRKFDIVLKSSICEIDTIRLHMPENYALETQIKPADICSDYGAFKTEIKEENGTMIYIQKLELVPGRYPASQFGALKDFYNKIEGLQAIRIALKKQ
jgi:transglutaminase-like putative cysteine protease